MRMVLSSSTFLLARVRVPSYKEIRKVLITKFSYAALSELTGALILAILQEFHNTAFVGSETDNFTDQTADEDNALGRLLQKIMLISFKLCLILKKINGCID